jgi:hypothetical protein
MASILWVEAICHNCNSQMYGQWVIGSKIPTKDFDKEAKARGWTRLSDGDYQCPKCTRHLS